MSLPQTYNYNAKWGFKATVKIDSGIGGTDAARGQNVALSMQAIMQQQALAEFVSAFAQAGHWLKVNSVTCTCTATDAHFVIPWDFVVAGTWWQSEITGTMLVNFDSDVADPTAHNSPQMQQVVWDAITSILATIAAHPDIVVAVVGSIIVAVITWTVFNLLLSWTVNIGTGAAKTVTSSLNTVGNNLGATVIVMGVLVLGGLGIVALFFTDRGKKVQRKTAQTARGAYQRVRRASGR